MARTYQLQLSAYQFPLLARLEFQNGTLIAGTYEFDRDYFDVHCIGAKCPWRRVTVTGMDGICDRNERGYGTVHGILEKAHKSPGPTSAEATPTHECTKAVGLGVARLADR